MDSCRQSFIRAFAHHPVRLICRGAGVRNNRSFEFFSCERFGLLKTLRTELRWVHFDLVKILDEYLKGSIGNYALPTRPTKATLDRLGYHLFRNFGQLAKAR